MYTKKTLVIEDTREGLQQMFEALKAGGGVGFDLTRLSKPSKGGKVYGKKSPQTTRR
jgi:hypothetical protein